MVAGAMNDDDGREGKYHLIVFKYQFVTMVNRKIVEDCLYIIYQLLVSSLATNLQWGSVY